MYLLMKTTTITFLSILFATSTVFSNGKNSREVLNSYKERVSDMFKYAYENYLNYAYPYDELRPLSCNGMDTWGKFSLSLIDALDTLAVVGNFTEFQRVHDLVSRMDFDMNVNVSVFETNIRVLGGLLSAHLLSKKAGISVEEGWPCSGPLLRLAENVANRLLPAFQTKTGMPYGTVNLKYGVPPGETAITCTAGVATFIIEFGTLSRLTGNPIYEDTAMNALNYLWKTRSSIGLVGNHIDVETGRWTATDAGIGAGVDSYFEYLVKGAILLQRPELMEMFDEYKDAISKYIKHDDWYLWVGMTHGKISLPIFQSLEAFWPGLLSLVGDLDQAVKTMHNYHQILKQYGFTPEYYNIVQGDVYGNRDGYPLRPELVESSYYLYKATGDPFFLQIGIDMVEAIDHSAKTPCGYATIKDVHDHLIEDRMESFFLAETTKYLYLLFDDENFISKNLKPELWGERLSNANGNCIVDAGGYVFNTEAHPIDISAVRCCSLRNSKDSEAIEKTVERLSIFDTFVNSKRVKSRFIPKFQTFNRTFPSYHLNDFDDSKLIEVPLKHLNSTNINKSESDNESDAENTSLNLENSRENSIQQNLSIQTLSYNAKPEVDSARVKSNVIDEPINDTGANNTVLNPHFEILMCSAQPFLSKLSILGQMFYVQ